MPFLLNEGMQTAYAVGAKWPREEFRQRLFTLRLAVAAAQRDRPAGAHALSSAFGMDPAPTAAMPGSFDGTLVGAVGAQLEMQRKEYHCATCR